MATSSFVVQRKFGELTNPRREPYYPLPMEKDQKPSLVGFQSTKPGTGNLVPMVKTSFQENPKNGFLVNPLETWTQMPGTTHWNPRNLNPTFPIKLNLWRT